MNNNQSANQKQLQAITTNSQYVRVIAGAGSGKTFVLTKRITYLINNLNINPQNILVLTFTNKACQEIRRRVENETNKSIHIFTFHSFCVYFLSYEIYHLNMNNNFKILDQDDKKKILHEIIKKDNNMLSQDLEKMILRESYFFQNHNNEKYKKIYDEYEKTKINKNALDFDDLILKTIYIMKNFSEVKKKWVNKIQYILIDEFQDTDNFQFELVEEFCNDKTFFYVVGDPDQTIYEWRGANQEIILNLDKKFKNIETIILDQNYRSSRAILDAANNLIKHNVNRIPKDMFTENVNAEEVELVIFQTCKDEAKYIADKIVFLKKNNILQQFKDVAILFRGVKHIMEYEKELHKQNIPYVIIGGQHFFKKKEIKNIISYIRLLCDLEDDVAFEHIINVAKRKIGKKTLDCLKKDCDKYKISFSNYIENAKSYNSKVSKKIINKLKQLIENIKKTQLELNNNQINDYPEIINTFFQEIGYLEYVKKLKNRDTVLKDLFFLLNTDMINFLSENNQQNLISWIRENALIATQDEIKNDNDHVNIMTIHATKGLEFDFVFIANMSKTHFSSDKFLNEDEEERRTYYVAFTRAKKKLFLSRNVEHNFGELPYIKEAGLEMPELFQRNRNYNGFNNYRHQYNDNYNEFEYNSDKDNEDSTFSIGDVVTHDVFGEGIVEKIIDKMFIQILFKKRNIRAIFLKSKIKKVK